eukprot:scaffold253089_cov31-Tisochrysis_lutea.AAC.1
MGAVIGKDVHGIRLGCRQRARSWSVHTRLTCLAEEAKEPTRHLGLFHERTTHLTSHPKVVAELCDELRVVRDGLATDLVEQLLTEHDLRAEHNRREGAVGSVVTHNGRGGAGGGRAHLRNRRLWADDERVAAEERTDEEQQPKHLVESSAASGRCER